MRYFQLITIIFLYFAGITSSFSAQTELFVQVNPPVHTPAALTTHVDISDPSGNNALDADEIIAVIVSVKNDGPGVAANVLVSLADIDNYLPNITISDPVHLGDILPGQSRQAEFKIQAARTIANGKLHLLARAFEQQGFDANDLQIVMETHAFVPPEFTLIDLGIDDQNQDGRIEPMEVTELTARIANTGKSAAKGVKVEVEFGENVFAAMEAKHSFHLGDLAPGESRDLNFAFVTNRRIPKGDAIPITIKVFESASSQRFNLPITLTMDTASQLLQQVIAASNDPEEIKIQPPQELAVDIERDIPLGLPSSTEDIALIIGNRNYRRRGLPRVEYALRDLEVMKKYLVKTFGFSPQRIVVEKDASKGTFEQLFGTNQQPRGKLADLVAQDGSSRVFVYYTGHGAPDLDSGDSFFLPVDADPDYIAATGYPLSLFYGNLKQIKARQMIVVIDACFSGRTSAGLLFANSSPAMLKVRETPANLKSGVVLTSSRSTEVSSWYPAKKHSMFTYFFLKGLRGAADSDQNRIITSGELDTWLNGKVPYWARRIAGRSQNPFMEGDNKIPLVHLREMESEL